jgi:hypothetical protein
LYGRDVDNFFMYLLAIGAFQYDVNLFANSCSYLLKYLSPTQEAVAYTYIFQCFPCVCRSSIKMFMNFELILVQNEEQRYTFSLLHVDIQFS